MVKRIIQKIADWIYNWLKDVPPYEKDDLLNS